MTLEEEIKHAEEVAEKNEKEASWFWGKEGNPNYENRVKCAEEHRQLAEWLKELKQLRAIEPFINKPCISAGVCEHDKMQVLDKLRAEIEQNAYPIVHGVYNHEKGMTLYGILQIIDKYKAESEVNNEK